MEMTDREYFFSDVPERFLPFSLQHTADMTEIDAALEKGMESVRAGRTHTLDEVDAELERKFGI